MRKMKILLTMALITALVGAAAAPVFAEEGIKFSGEAKTGVYWRTAQENGKEKDELVGLHSKDDAGGESQQGRFRLNMEYENANGFGFKARVQWQNWGDTVPENWIYGFGYGNFFENQLTVSVGKLGGSPWGTGGPELWKDLETNEKSGGMRVEWKPEFVPGSLNVGFILMYFNSDRDQGWPAEKPIPIWLLFQESIVGVSYTMDGLFHARFGYKFDSEYDAIQDNKMTGGKGEDEIVYRVEERILTEYLPGIKLWALGYLFAVSAQNDAITYNRNYMFAEYEPPEMFGMDVPFTAQVRLGYDSTPSRSTFHFKPSFYWNFSIGEYRKLISVGASFWYGQDFGNKKTEGSPYEFIELEPKVQLNFSSSYIAFVYNWRKEYMNEAGFAGTGYDPLKQTQYINLRFCIYY